ncbi:undecaprenyldiphospho-muramoylpentapeptide beta-N-acetylglucosaminyltransferase [Angustibacter sp. McL0619]|uniref:undecaprenyldiphospho-muramoylpentapeptide beta-N-acetylglucosaminyltransferase n=1 Tax=Angustibacter sp. McL0619 TaxID=3415676 RepID=UPI003CEA9C10
MTTSVLLAGGGTAGHVSPLLALADCLRRRNPAMTVTVLGTAEGLEARLVPAHGYELRTVPKVPLPRRPGPDLVRLPGRLRGAVRAAADAVQQSGADVVVGFGGYVAAPAYLAARRRGVPIVVHEQNPLPGVANRLGARLTRFVATTFPDTKLAHSVHTGMPLRHQISSLASLTVDERAARQMSARAALGLDRDRTTLLVTGGSLGAQRLNETFGAAAADLRAAGVQVLHVSGTGKQVDVEPAVDGQAPYVVLPYADRMDEAYLAADLVVCRAGANTVCELATVGLPAAYVPLPIGNGEQRLNAEPVVAAGGGLLVDDVGCTPDWVRQVLLPLLADPTSLHAMGEAATRFVVPDADERLADLVLSAAGSRS